MTPAQRNLIDAAKHLLDVIAEPNEIAYELTIDNATNRLDDAIKAAEADDSDGWTPCGPDGPFPDSGVEVEVTVSVRGYSSRVRQVKTAWCGVWYVKPWAEWLGIEPNETVIAWKHKSKPYDPKGQV